MSDEPENRKRAHPLFFATTLLCDEGAEYDSTEAFIVTAIVSRGLAVQPDTGEEACFLTDETIARRAHVSVNTVKRWLVVHGQRRRPVLMRAWPGQTFGTDGKYHPHKCARFVLLRTEAQVAEALRRERERQAIERERAEKRERTNYVRTKLRPLRERLKRRRRAV